MIGHAEIIKLYMTTDASDTHKIKKKELHKTKTLVHRIMYGFIV